MHTLRVEKISKSIKDTKIIKEVSLEIKSGEVVGLLGPNGAGKTTSFYMICGLIKLDKGNIFLNDIDITRVPLHQRARLGIGYLPQESSVFKDLSVEENVLLAAEIIHKSKSEQKQKTNEILELLNIMSIRQRKGLSLSGGERRRCEIARALVMMPRFLLLDEPFAGVDPIAVGDIQSIINDLKKLNIGVLITDHNVRETLGVCDNVYVIKQGELLVSGASKDIANNPLVKAHYLGEDFKI